MDTNPVENAIRPVALTRKNALFAGHEVGAENWALLASIIATCKLNDVNPVTYVADILQAILSGHPQNRIDELIPWRSPQDVKPRRIGVSRALILSASAIRFQPQFDVPLVVAVSAAARAAINATQESE